VAISDITGALKNTSGLDIPSIIKYSKENGKIKGYTEADAIDSESLLHEECDVLIPAALGGVLNRLILLDLCLKYNKYRSQGKHFYAKYFD